MSGAPNQATAGSRPQPQPYFVGLVVDMMCISGFSLLLFAALRGWGGTIRSEWAWTLAGYLVWVINWPHFSATSYRLYGSRAHIRQYPVTAMVTPVLVAAGVLASFASPVLVAPYFIKLFLIWSPYHFSGQTIGISLLYARRGGWNVGSIQRYSLQGLVYGTFLLGSVRAEVGLGSGQYFGIPYPTFGLPPSVPTAIEALVWVSAIVFALSVGGRAAAEKRLPPLLFLLPSLTQYFWFVQGARIPNFVEFVPALHSLQYLLIAWSMQLKEKADRIKATPGGGYVTKESLRWYVLNIGGGAVLFAVMPWAAEKAGITTALANAIMVSAVQIHHFFVDGVIWKLRTSSVVSPLLVNIPEMIRDASRKATTPATAPAGEREAA